MSNFGELFVRSFLPNLAYQLPVLITLIVGIILAITRWRKNPRVSLLSLIALLTILFVRVVSTFTSSVLPIFLYSTVANPGIILSVLSIVYTLLSTASWVLLLIALFGKGKPKAPVVES